VDIREEIVRLKNKKRAIILAHNYQRDEIQEIADYTGDSLGLSKKAASIQDKELIVFCGVYFMAETAKILSPDKKVIIPDRGAGCPMADMITAQQVREFRNKYPGSVVVCYVNSTAEVKAESDMCCTSANAVQVVLSLPADKTILFVPDRYLGDFVRKKTSRNIVCWKGFCPTHARVTRDMVLAARKKHPNAVVLVHPECTEDVVDAADEAMSTGQMIAYVKKSGRTEFIIGTEKGILYQLKKENPRKDFYLVGKDVICPNMKKIDLQKLLVSLQEEQDEVVVAPAIMERARKAISAMLLL